MHIVLDTDYVDETFLYYLFSRRKAALRTSNKRGRPAQKTLSVLLSYPVPLPSRVEQVIYDTGLEKQGLDIQLGEREIGE